MDMFSRIKSEALDLLFPNRCLGCQKIGALLCLPCRDGLGMIPPQCFVCGKFSPGTRRIVRGRTCVACRESSKIFAFLSPFSYGNPKVKDLIHYLKYNRVREISGVLAQILGDYLKKFRIVTPANVLVVPIPLHKARERTRGFNQAELIARRFAQIMDLNFLDPGRVLLRNKDTKPQFELSRTERKSNLAGAFKVSSPELVRGQTLILLDDVKTTGATLEEAARILKEAGAKRVWAVTVAH